MNFSIILNSRGRPKLLDNMIKSIVNNASRADQLEILVAVDDDDKETIDYSESMKSVIKFVIQPRPSSLNTSLTNLGLMAEGKYVFNVNDDVQFLTKGWDTIVLNKIANFKSTNAIADDIIYCGVSDNSVDKAKGVPYASFPIISKQAINTIGVFMYPAFVGLGGDSSIWRVYDAIGRVIQIPEVKLDHFYHSSIFAVMTPDLTAHEMRQSSWKTNLDPFTYDVSPEVEKLKEFIKGYGKNI